MPPPRSRTRILDTSAHPEEQERSDRLFFSPEMSSPSKRREMDLMKLMMSDYKVGMVNDGIQEFFAEFRGPNEGIYQGGVWKVRVELAYTYPYKSSSIGSINMMYHPNVDETLSAEMVSCIGIEAISILEKMLLDPAGSTPLLSMLPPLPRPLPFTPPPPYRDCTGPGPLQTLSSLLLFTEVLFFTVPQLITKRCP